MLNKKKISFALQKNRSNTVRNNHTNKFISAQVNKFFGMCECGIHYA